METPKFIFEEGLFGYGGDARVWPKIEEGFLSSFNLELALDFPLFMDVPFESIDLFKDF